MCASVGLDWGASCKKRGDCTIQGATGYGYCIYNSYNDTYIKREVPGCIAKAPVVRLGCYAEHHYVAALTKNSVVPKHTFIIISIYPLFRNPCQKWIDSLQGP
jgi:hypothetical protein